MSRRFVVVAHLPKPESTAFSGDLPLSPAEWCIEHGTARADVKANRWREHFNHVAIHEIKEPS